MMKYRKIAVVGTTGESGIEFLDEHDRPIGKAECWPPELAFVLMSILGRDADALDKIAMFCSAEDRRKAGP